MKSRIVFDGGFRARRSKTLQAQLAELRQSIQARHAAEWENSGTWKRWRLRWRMAAEFRRERKAIEPSPHTLFQNRTVAAQD